MPLVGSRVVILAAAIGLAAACTSGEPAAETSPGSSAPSQSVRAGPSQSPARPGGPARPEKAERVVAVPRPHSLQAVMRKDYHSGRVQVTREVGDYGAYTRNEVRYRSDGLWVTGIMNVPKGRGRFPALVLNHGYIEPSIYVTGQGLAREQDYLARAGFVVLHTDYRGHAGSDDGTELDRETRLGYTEDVITAVLALRKMPYVDRDRIGLLGRSMGGGVTYNVLVAKPGLVDAAVVYAPVSSLFVDNYNRWTRPERPDTASLVRDRLDAEGGIRAAFHDLSPRGFFDRISEPILIHHGTADDSCPLRWSRATLRALEKQGKRARLVVYPGEPHAFVAGWERSIVRTVRFFDRNL